MRFHRLILGIFAFAALAAPAAAAKHKITWLLGHKNLDYFEEAAQSFKTAVESGSKGEIAVEIVVKDEEKDKLPGTNDPEIAALVAKGEAQMGHSFADVMGGFDPRMRAFQAPYLMRGYRHMEGVLEGPVGRDLLKGLSERGVTGLSFTYSGGANGVATKSKPIRKPEDLKGMKVGVYGDVVDAAWLTRLGAIPVPVRHDRESLLPLAREGKLDAVVATWRNFEQASLQEEFKRFSLPGVTYLVSVTYINEKFFKGLPARHQKLIREASLEAGRIERAKTIELNEDAKGIVLAKGVRAIPLPEAGKAAFAAALAPAYEGELGAALGRGLEGRVRGASDADVHPAAAKFASR